MESLFASGLVGMLDTVLDSVNWTKLGSAGAVASATLAAAVPIAGWYARIRTEKLTAELEIEKQRVTTVQAELGVEVQKRHGLEVANAALNQTCESLSRSVAERDAAIAGVRSEAAKLRSAGQQVYREVVSLRPLKTRNEDLEKKLADSEKFAKLLRGQLDGNEEQIAELAREIERRQKLLDQAESRMRKAQRLQGYLTQAKALQKVPKFRPLAERGRAVISVLNLKGGVGKTTITAHLAGALARRGYRVLMVDLDLQGSLTALMLSNEEIADRFKAKRMTQHFFKTAADGTSLDLSRYAVPVAAVGPDGAGQMSILPTTDQLAYSELNLTLGWLLRQGERDARFLLRKVLHTKAGGNDYDIVLLDCPPLLNISCVNALAASDFLLVPTTLSVKAAERIPVLLRAVHQESFRKHVNSQLGVMGVVANRANQLPLKGSEANLWQELPKYIDSELAPAVTLFGTVIGRDVKIASAEERFVHPEPGSRAQVMFDALAAEVGRGLPSVCRKASPNAS